ncbi:cAMP-dependent protein kinase inhibitor beta-like [Sabethes cyaneus]|uniref:cAMP-dependent protein kinase inhibitor beta-like n=1 Tax=Sabethes cyaneus TaxID=53552 RepID=UPI00237DEC1C|nr:cAMP-dependent protein kinase inhibitor beta-like [Sabethes cyaneus]
MDKMKDTTTTTVAGGVPVGGSSEGGGGGGVLPAAGDEFHSEFYNTGRIGRRNALPDILGSHCTTTTADLPTQMGALSTSECSNKPPNNSKTPTGNGTAMITSNPTNSSTGGGGS